MGMVVSGSAGLTFPDASTQGKSAANGQTGSAPFYSARAWVNFNGTGTVAIRASGNVSSITDGGTGDYTVNFTTAMPDANYTVVSGTGYPGGATAPQPGCRIGMASGSTNSPPTASSVRLGVVSDNAATWLDVSYVTVAIFR